MPVMRNPRRSQEEWSELITEARRSGLSDSEWCRQNSVSLNTFHKDVVRVGLVSESLEGTHRKLSDPSDQYEKTPVIDISFPHGHIRVSNEIRPELLSHLLEGVRGCL